MLAAIINWQKRKHGLTPVSIFYRDPFPLNLTQLKTFTSVTNAFFLLRVPLTISGQPVTIGSSKGMLTLTDSKYPCRNITFDTLFKCVSAVAKKYGISVTNSWCDDAPLFELRHSTSEGMKNFVRSAEKVQNELASRISAHFTERPAASHPSTTHPLVMVHSKVFLLTPDPINKSAGLVLVTPENLSTCLVHWEESKIFKFADLFRPYRMDGTYRTANDMEVRSVEVVTPSPDQGVHVPIPHSMEKKPIPIPEEKHKAIQKRLYGRVEEIQSDIGLNDTEIAVNKQALCEAQHARDISWGRLNEAEKKTLEAKSNMVKLTEKESNIQRQLELKERELNALQKLQEKETKELQALIVNKNEEIQKLRQELIVVQTKLILEEEKAHSIQEQFRQASKELTDKSARVQDLEKEQRKLETQLEIEKMRAGQLLMLATAASKSQHHQEIENQLKAAKQEADKNNKLMNALKESATHKDGEVKGLSAQLQAKDGLLQTLLAESTYVAQEQLQKLTAEMSELRNRLSKAEDEQQKTQLQMYTAQLKHELLQNVVTTLPDELTSPEESTWEYKAFTKNSAEIMEKLANVLLAARIADKLYADGIIGNDVKQRAHIHAPDVTEIDRVRPIITALKDKIWQNVQIYHRFRGILESSFPSDAETALSYIPEEDPTFNTMEAVTPSNADQDSTVIEAASMKAPTPDQDPTVNEAIIMEVVTPAPDQGPSTNEAGTKETVTPSQEQDSTVIEAMSMKAPSTDQGPSTNEAGTKQTVTHSQEQDSTVNQARSKKAHSPDQDPTTNEAETKEIAIPSHDQEPTVNAAITMEAVTPAPDQDPTTNEAETQETAIPSPDQGHTTGQQQITVPLWTNEHTVPLWTNEHTVPLWTNEHTVPLLTNEHTVPWWTGEDTPESKRKGAVVSHGKMAYFNSVDSTSVHSYDSEPQPPDCHSRDSALVMAEGKFTTVGGKKDGGPTNSLDSRAGKDKGSMWKKLLSRMPTWRRKRISKQQSWSKEDLEAAPVNNYTTLTLHQPPDLPPSPSSLMSSLFVADIDPKWEFPRENIQLLEVLYEGQYTILYKGTAHGIKEQKPIEVAIKSVKEDASEDDVKSLVCEMELLASLGPHPNILSLMRVCTIGKPLYMVMEYMCHGDLLGFLRESRGHYGMYTISPGIRNQPPCLHLSSRDLLSIAAKVANGMRFLADRKLAHRALCARNILVGTSMDIKIYNVGAFDMTFENRDTLIKWLSPETLFDGSATTYSDVWSFGVLLWELVTVGGTPYAEILPGDLYTQLYKGMRMPKPLHCAQEIYDIMRLCWERNPSDRPYFAIIQDQLEVLEDSKLSFLDLRNYSEYDYSQFEKPPQLYTDV